MDGINGITWNGVLLDREEITLRVLMATCGDCWASDGRRCHFTRSSRGGIIPGQDVVLLVGTRAAVHAARIERAIVKGVLPDGLSPTVITSSLREQDAVR